MKSVGNGKERSTKKMDDPTLLFMKERDRHGLPKIVVRAILKLLSENKTHKEIAELYGVSRETITAINTGRSHKKEKKSN